MSHLPRYSPEYGDDPCPSDMETNPGSGGDGDGNVYWQNYTHEPDQQDYYDNQTDNYVPTGDPNDPAGSNDFPEVSTGDEHGYHFQPTQAAQDAHHHQSTDSFVDEHGHHFQPTQAGQDADRRQSTESFVDERRGSFDRREEYRTAPHRASLRRRAEVSDRTREPYRKCRPRDEQLRSKGSSGNGSSSKESSSKGSSSNSSSSKGSSDRDSSSKRSSGKGSSRKDR